jgi:PPOX class probable F420-dependent enzyme
VLTTIDEQGGPHAVPICFAVTGTDIVTPIDHKPKSTTALARVRHIQSRPVATVLFDRYDDDWANLGWVMVRGSARLEDPRIARESLAARYPQYRARPPQGELIVVTPRRINWWLKK